MSIREQIFQVESILDYRIQKGSGRQEFKVKWKGYPMKDCTWQPTVHLESCMDLVKDFKVKRGLWFKRQPYKEPIKDSTARQSEASSEDEQQKLEIQPTPRNEVHKQDNCNCQSHAQKKADEKAVIAIYLVEKIEPPCLQPDLTILKMHTNSSKQIFFKVLVAGKIKLLSRSQIYKINIKCLLEFYEKFINILPKSLPNS